MTAEARDWQPLVQETIPKFGTREPVALDDMTRHLYSESGRPVHHTALHPEHVPFKTAPGRKNGRRAGTQAEFASHAEIKRNMPDALGFITYLRNEMYPSESELTPSDIKSLIHIFLALPYWLIYRSDNPLENGKIPVYIVSAVKAIRGMSDPFNVSSEGVKNKVTDEIIPMPTVEQLTQVDPFADYVMDYGFLLSRNNPGESCPATREDIKDVAEVVFDEMTENRERIGEMAKAIGITRENMDRIREFGIAFTSGMQMAGMFEKLMKDNPELKIAVIEGKQLDVQLFKDGPIVDLVGEYLRIINSAGIEINRSLERDIPRPVERADLARSLAA